MPLSQGSGLSVIGGLSLRGGLSVGSGFSPVLGPTLNLQFSTLSADQMTTLGVTFSRPSQATIVDATGKITYAPNNLLLNSATLSTQSVTVNPANYILSFKGTGTVTLSGASTAGPLVGTGATDRVYLKITPTAGSLTCTVSGSVTEAQLEAVTYETTPRTYNATTSAAYYGPRFTYDPVTLAAQGLLIEEARTNLVPTSQTFNGTGFTMSNVTVGAAIVSPDGTSNALLFSATATAVTTISLGRTFVAGAHTASFFVKASTAPNVVAARTNWITGNPTGTFNFGTGVFTPGAGQTGAIENWGNGWYRCWVTGTAIAANVATVLYLGAYGSIAAGQGLYLWGYQIEAGTFPTSVIPTFGVALARSADNASMTGTNFSSWFNQSEGTFVVEAVAGPAGTNRRLIVASDGTVANRTSLIFTTGNAAQGFTTVASATSGTVSSGSIAAGTSYKLAFAFKASDFALSVSGAAAVASASGSLAALTSMQIGAQVGGAVDFINGTIKSIRYYPTRLSNAQLQALST